MLDTRKMRLFSLIGVAQAAIGDGARQLRGLKDHSECFNALGQDRDCEIPNFRSEIGNRIEFLSSEVTIGHVLLEPSLRSVPFSKQTHFLPFLYKVQ